MLLTRLRFWPIFLMQRFCKPKQASKLAECCNALVHFPFRSQDLINNSPYCLPYMTVTWRIWYWINQLILPDRYFSLFSSLACLILQWYCKDKIFLGHSWEKDPLVLCLQYRDDGDLWIDKYFIDWTTEATNRLNHLSSISQLPYPDLTKDAWN